MKRKHFMAGLGVAGLLGGGVTLLLQPSSEPSSTGTTSADPDPAAPPRGVGPFAPSAAPAPPLRDAPGVDVGKGRARWTEPGENRWATPMASRVLRKVVRRALLEAPVQKRLAGCVDRDMGFGGGESPGPAPRAQPAVLMLEMETHGGEVRIVEAPVRDWGGGSPEVVSCAQGVLLGKIIAAAPARPGFRVRMPFPVSPRSETVSGRDHPL